MRTARDRVASPHFLFLEVTGLVLIPVLPFDSGAPRLPLNRGEGYFVLYCTRHVLCPSLTFQKLQLVQRRPLKLLVIPYLCVPLTVSDPTKRRGSQPRHTQKHTPVQIRVLGIHLHTVFGQRLEDEPRLSMPIQHVKVCQRPLHFTQVLVGMHERIRKDRVPWVRIDCKGRRLRRERTCRWAWLFARERVRILG